MRSMWRVFAAAAGLMALVAPSTAAADSWWSGGYHDDSWRDGGYHHDTSWGEPVPPGPAGPLYGCENSTLPGTDLGLVKTTTPPPGTPVRPGDEIVVDITWRIWDWMGPDLHKAIDCVYINGLFAPHLSGGEKPTPNDGHFAFHYFVPLDVPPGSEICDQGFVSGPNGYEEYGRQVSNVVCFPVDTPPPPAPPPCCAPPPPCCAPPAVEETTTTTTPTTTTTTTTVPDSYSEVDRVQLAAPEETPPAAEILPVQQAVLPRTGGDGNPARLAAGALALAAVAGRARRFRRR